jgi:hypothetical protein
MSGLFPQVIPTGPSPFTAQGIGTFPGPFQPQALATNALGNYAPIQFSAQSPFNAPSPFNASFAQQPLQQIVQSLLIVPQQLQQLLQLAQIQQQQVQYLLQSIPQQIQQLQQQLVHQPGFQSFTPHQPWGTAQSPLGTSQPFGPQTGHVM